MFCLSLLYHFVPYICFLGVVNVKTHISHKDRAANPASLQTVDDLVGDVGVVHQARRDVDHGAIWSRAHSIHVHAIHSTHSSHSSMAAMASWRASTLTLVDFSLSDHTIRVLTESVKIWVRKTEKYDRCVAFSFSGHSCRVLPLSLLGDGHWGCACWPSPLLSSLALRSWTQQHWQKYTVHSVRDINKQTPRLILKRIVQFPFSQSEKHCHKQLKMRDYLRATLCCLKTSEQAAPKGVKNNSNE